MRMRISSVVAPIVLSAVALSGCSSSSSDGGAGASATTVAAEQNIRTVAPADGEAVIEDSDDVVVLDVRTPAEYQQSHLANAENIDYYESDFKAQLEQLDKNQTYVMYCQTGNRSAKVASIMRELGFTDVAEITGGITAWQNDGLPVERG